MKKISYFILLISLFGILLSAFWSYQKYFKKPEKNILYFQVERGNIQEFVRARGEVIPQKEFDLGFSFAGVLDSVFVKEGDFIKKGDLLAQAELNDLEAELSGLFASKRQSEADLAKLITGATKEELVILENKISQAQKALEDSELNLKNAENTASLNLINVYKDVSDVLNSAYAKADDSVNNQTDQLFSDDLGQNPKLTFSISDFQLKVNSENERKTANSDVLTLKQISSESLLARENYERLDTLLDGAENNLISIKNFLSILSSAVDLSLNLSQTEKTNYKTYVSSALTSINASISSINSQKQKIALQKSQNKTSIDSATASINGAYSTLQIAESELNLKKAKTRDEDMTIAREKIQIAQSQIDVLEEKIKKSKLYSPLSGIVNKILIEPKEVFGAGMAIMIVADTNQKIQTDISELDIVKVQKNKKDGVIIKFDAIPEAKIFGEIISIDPKEIIKDGDVYFRANILMAQSNEKNIRPGMKTDLIINTVSKINILKIPEIAIYPKGNKFFTRILKNEKEREVEIEIGISDGEFVEIKNGLKEGDTILVLSD